jgi:hypothetical protein
VERAGGEEMKQEPLKGKDMIWDDTIKHTFDYEDVVSAVKWLKSCFIIDADYTQGYILSMIDEAFEDVMKK